MTKKIDYLIKLTYDPQYKGYVADVLNLYGCMSQGKTKAQAIKNAKKAIKAYMQATTKSIGKSSQISVASVYTPLPTS